MALIHRRGRRRAGHYHQWHCERPHHFEAAPGQTPVINSSGDWNAINIKASYIVVKGFTVVGDAANYTLQQHWRDTAPETRASMGTA